MSELILSEDAGWKLTRDNLLAFAGVTEKEGWREEEVDGAGGNAGDAAGSVRVRVVRRVLSYADPGEAFRGRASLLYPRGV